MLRLSLKIQSYNHVHSNCNRSHRNYRSIHRTYLLHELLPLLPVDHQVRLIEYIASDFAAESRDLNKSLGETIQSFKLLLKTDVNNNQSKETKPEDAEESGQSDDVEEMDNRPVSPVFLFFWLFSKICCERRLLQAFQVDDRALSAKVVHFFRRSL